VGNCPFERRPTVLAGNAFHVFAVLYYVIPA